MQPWPGLTPHFPNDKMLQACKSLLVTRHALSTCWQACWCSSAAQGPDHEVLCRYQGYSTILFAAALGHTQIVIHLAGVKQGSLDDETPDGSTLAHLILDHWRSSPSLRLDLAHCGKPQVCRIFSA